MATYHVIDTTGGQTYSVGANDLRLLLQQLKRHKYPHRVIACLIYEVTDMDARCTSYHTIYTPEGMAPLPGYAIYMRLLMAGVAHNRTSDGGLVSNALSDDHKLNAMGTRG